MVADSSFVGIHPPFVTVQELIRRHALTNADRRKTVGYLQAALTLSHPLDHQDSEIFHRALLDLYGQGPEKYRGFTSTLAGTSSKASQRALHFQSFSHVLKGLTSEQRAKVWDTPKL